ncbi:GNAT family N-acetyltransferase [uncultured Microbulbifer sp.]|uniref:GNAT family N-acetyltransferase n=1 Tax=uncultured Microbulbifer sp. TaxID=348147 RepID=UPI0025E20706|nr:GNAT family N-acetyltransferase [uncultured Microbulbifer sp.]
MFNRKTARLAISELTREDGELMLAILNDPDFIHNVADRGVRTVQEAQDYIEKGPVASYRRHNFGMYKVALKDGTAVGLCGLVKRDFLDDVDIGYAFLPQYRGRGYALEAAQAVMDFARNGLGLKRIVAIVSPANPRSIALLEKLGMRSEGCVTVPDDNKEVALLAWQSV